MKLIVGLGNPGKEYEGTRHNIGFSFVDYYLKNKGVTNSWKEKMSGLLLSEEIFGEKVIFLKPQTFMNLSGNSVSKVVNYYHIPLKDILIISDDMDLLIGNFKLKSTGSSGGHNGLKDIGDKLSSNNFKRLKIGISKTDDFDKKDYVLGKFNKSEKEVLDKLFNDLIPVMDDYFKLPFEDLMSKYNRKNR